ncbi:isoliquiritigenin 2'-O-methyltransferase-like isoform X2 [Glycine soja]|uniref:Isoliquiritigenin 2'-O-methyltransferase isoform A n=1 Tax=Glycine soja TaxID=3848 RepID=A0A445F6N8_GLYSO|nr:isoliquiritigenin 2'-O-methyltransferase-like isoform X2 [Glycine soja]RZB44440.1 Isoliquiritigenin 2'-O-methyltransferase isoform A [Glycine soja]
MGESNVMTKTEDGACLSAMLLSTNLVYPAVLNAAIELNLFEIIAKATPAGSFMSSHEIASKLPTQHPDQPNRLDRMLRLLASYSVLTTSTRTTHHGATETVYGLSQVGQYFVPDGTRGYLASFTTFVCYPPLLQVWLNFKEAMVDADIDLFKKIHGVTMYQYMEKDPKMNQIFNKSMANLCATEMSRILEIYTGFEGISTLVDVGGGNGQNLKMIISKYPLIKGINFDLPQVIENAPPLPGIEHVGGDMFARVPQGDAIILKAVCHNWSDEKCIEFLRNCHKALSPNGKVIVVEFILPEEPEPTEESQLVSTLDNLMFITVGGRERTQKQYETLCKLSGFSNFQVACRAFSSLGVMEFYK